MTSDEQNKKKIEGKKANLNTRNFFEKLKSSKNEKENSKLEIHKSMTIRTKIQKLANNSKNLKKHDNDRENSSARN